MFFLQVICGLGYHQPCLRTYFQDPEEVLIPRPVFQRRLQRTSKLPAAWPSCALDFLGLPQEPGQLVSEILQETDGALKCVLLQPNGGRLVNWNLISNAIANLFLVKFPSGVVSRKTSERHLFSKKSFISWSGSEEEEICCYVCF